MDIIAIIEKYVELNVRRENLNEAIQSEKDGYIYAKIEGEEAYHDGRYESEKGYNESARRHNENQKKSEKELLQVEQLLHFTHQTYTKAIESLNEIQLKEAAITISSRKDDLERKIKELSQRRDWASSKGDVAYSKQDYKEEQEFNRVATECYLEIKKIEPALHYYEAFINNLNYHADKKVEQDFGLNSKNKKLK